MTTSHFNPFLAAEHSFRSPREIWHHYKDALRHEAWMLKLMDAQLSVYEEKLCPKKQTSGTGYGEVIQFPRSRRSPNSGASD